MKSPFPRFPRVWLALLLLAWLPATLLFAEAADEFVPCVIHERVKITFPVQALNSGITRGEVSLMLEVDREGRLGDVLVFAHSGYEFAKAALTAVEKWRFSPALLGGEPINSVNTINVQFEVSGVTAYTKLPDQPDQKRPWNERYQYRPFGLAELDGVPRAVSRPSPMYPREWIRQGRTGAVTLDYFIDESGHTRFPRVVGHADDLLGAATIEAVKSWQFESPLRFGQPVLAQIRQVFYFNPERRQGSEEGTASPR